MHLSDKHIVITGGTSGIGRKLVEKLAADNQLIVIGRNTSKLNDLSHQYPNMQVYRCDLSSLSEVEQVADQVLRDHPKIDVLINNAAVQFTPKFLDDDFRFESIQHEITVNFTSICYFIYLLLPALSDAHRRSIILNINSGLALAPKASSAIYCATKGGLNILSQSLRYQFEDTNIRVLQAILALVDTEMTTGRGKSKMSTEIAACSIIHGIKNEISDHFIGKAKLLRVLLYIFPPLARRILKKY